MPSFTCTMCRNADFCEFVKIDPSCVFTKKYNRHLIDGTEVTTRQALCQYYLETVPGAKSEYLDFQGANMVIYRR